MICIHNKYFVIYRGDDTDFPGNQELVIELKTDRDLSGCKAHFSFQGYKIDFDEIQEDKRLSIVFPSKETKNFSVGHSFASLRITHGEGDNLKVLTLSNSIDILVTNNVHEAYHGHCKQAIAVNIANGKPSGNARMLPPYLHYLEFDDVYKDDAKWYYDNVIYNKTACSVRRKGNTIERNYDWHFDDSAVFMIRVSKAKGRFSSIGMAGVGMSLSETLVTNGSWSRYFKCLPGHTLDGINEKGVFAEVNVTSMDGIGGWHGNEINCLGAVRWVLDNATDAESAAQELADKVFVPERLGINFHYMIADATSTWIVENGEAHSVSNELSVMTNFDLFPSYEPSRQEGVERYEILLEDEGARPISDAWFTNAYSYDTDWISEFSSAEEMAIAKKLWNDGLGKDSHRGQNLDGKYWWQTVHTSTYDIEKRAMTVSVQENDNGYVFAIAQSSGGVPADYDTVKQDALKGATHADSTGNPHQTNGREIPIEAGAEQSITGVLEYYLADLRDHIENLNNPHETTASQVGAYTTQEVDDKITRFSAHYLTMKDAAGRFVPFPTHEALSYAKTHHTEENPQFFYAKEGFTPTKNDYCVVLDDETVDHKTTRYSFVGDWPSGSWQYQYPINDTQFSQEQWAAINSLVSVDADGNLCFDDIPIVNTNGELLETDPTFSAWKDAVQIALGANASVATGSYKQIAIGSHATSGGQNAIALGSSEPMKSNGPRATAQNAIAIGAGANATAQNAVQIFAGTNSKSGTIQVGNKTVAFLTDIPISQSDIDDYRYYKGHWEMGTVYGVDDIVRAVTTVEGEETVVYFKSLKDNNLAQNPFTSTTYWRQTTDDEGLEKLTLFVKAAIAGLTGADINVSKTDSTKISAALASKLDTTGGEIDGDLAVTGDITKGSRSVATTDQLDYALVQSTVASRSIVDIPDAGASGASITVPAGFRDLILCTHGKVASIAFADTGLSPFGDDLPTEGDNLITITRLPLNRVFVRVISMESKTYGN